MRAELEGVFCKNGYFAKYICLGLHAVVKFVLNFVGGKTGSFSCKLGKIMLNSLVIIELLFVYDFLFFFFKYTGSYR